MFVPVSEVDGGGPVGRLQVDGGIGPYEVAHVCYVHANLEEILGLWVSWSSSSYVDTNLEEIWVRWVS